MSQHPSPAELRRLQLRITGLVYARAVREAAGARPDELARYSTEIDREQRRLARLEAAVPV